MKQSTIDKYTGYLSRDPKDVTYNERGLLYSARRNVSASVSLRPDDEVLRDQAAQINRVCAHVFAKTNKVLTPDEVKARLPEPKDRKIRIVKGTEQPWAVWKVGEPVLTKRELQAKNRRERVESAFNRFADREYSTLNNVERHELTQLKNCIKNNTNYHYMLGRLPDPHDKSAATAGVNAAISDCLDLLRTANAENERLRGLLETNGIKT